MSLADGDRTIKIAHGEDTRRKLLRVPTDATPIDTYNAIQSAAAALFGFDAESFCLKYEDEEHDLCTLTAQTVSDLLSVSPTGALRLTLELRAPPTQLQDTTKESAAMDVDSTDTSTPDMGAATLRQRIGTLLEKASLGELQMALAFVQGMDPVAMHGFLPMLTQFMPAVANSGDAKLQQTFEDLAILQQMEPEELKELVLSEIRSQVEKKSSAQTPSDAAPPNPLEALLGGLQCCNSQGNAQDNPWQQSMGAASAGKGMGDGIGACDPVGMNPLLGMLGAVLAGKGAGKGAGMGPEPGLQTVTSSSSTLTASSPACPSPSPEADSSARTTFDESVDDLVNMGLVNDRQVARELLTKHGDLSTVVSVLTEE